MVVREYNCAVIKHLQNKHPHQFSVKITLNKAQTPRGESEICVYGPHCPYCALKTNHGGCNFGNCGIKNQEYQNSADKSKAKFDSIGCYHRNGNNKVQIHHLEMHHPNVLRSVKKDIYWYSQHDQRCLS